jgi:hypothetical protein
MSVWILMTGCSFEPGAQDPNNVLVFDNAGAAKEVLLDLEGMRLAGASPFDVLEVNGHTIELGDWTRVMEKQVGSWPHRAPTLSPAEGPTQGAQ